MTDREKIEIKERIDREKFLSVFGSKMDFVESENLSEYWDMSGTTFSLDENGKNFFVEIKDRDYESTRYPTCYLEVKKYQNLKAVAKDNGNANIHYSCSYTDGLVFVFKLNDLSLLDVDISIQYLPKTTISDIIEYENKQVIELPFSAAKKYKLKK